MRLLLDSSVLIAAHISRAGVCAELFEDVLATHELVASEFILEEVARKLTDKFRFPADMVARIEAFIRGNAARVEPSAVPPESCRDPEDLPVLGTALAGEADLLITVDKDLLDLGSFNSIAIVRPGDFWRRVGGA